MPLQCGPVLKVTQAHMPRASSTAQSYWKKTSFRCRAFCSSADRSGAHAGGRLTAGRGAPGQCAP